VLQGIMLLVTVIPLRIDATCEKWCLQWAQVVELGQVGQATSLSQDSGQSMPGGSQDISDFYVHSQRGAKFGDASVLTEAFLKAGDAKVSPSLNSEFFSH
jgi:hypothetical protein